MSSLQPADAKEAKELVRQELDALNAQDVEGVLAFYTDDVRFVDISLDDELVGKEAMREFMVGLYRSFPDAHVELRSLFGENGQVCAEYELLGTHRGSIEGEEPTGRTFRLSAASVYRWDGARFTEEIFYWNAASLRAQLGLTAT
jgi:steroid delta-isomerase-like uncharacterized protein